MRYRWRILAVSLAVCLVTAVVEIVVSDVVDRANLPLLVLADLGASGVTVLGAVFLSGFLTRLVGGAAEGDGIDIAPLRRGGSGGTAP